MRMIWSAAALVLLLGAAGCSRAPWHQDLKVEDAQVGTIRNSSQFGDQLYFGAQPQKEDFVALSAMGVKTVVNLRTEQEMAEVDFDEEAVAHEAGMNYFNIPIGRSQPDEGTLNLLHSLIEDPDRRPMLIHCASSNRVGYLWATYRGQRTGLTAEEALEEGKSAGLRSPVLMEWVRDTLGADPTAEEEEEAAGEGGSEATEE